MSTGTDADAARLGRRSRPALPASRRHIWWALVPTVLITFAAQFASGVSESPISPALSSVISYDTYVVAYLALTWRALPRMRPEDLAAWAVQVDAQPRRFRDLLLGRPVGLAIPVSAAVTGFIAGAWALPRAAELDPERTVALTTLIVVAVLGSWLLMHTAYTTHYAYSYYRQDGDRGLGFPGQAEPECLDFAYFSCAVATTFGTTDVEVCSRRFRRIVLGHALLSFAFNTGVLALTLSVLIR